MFNFYSMCTENLYLTYLRSDQVKKPCEESSCITLRSIVVLGVLSQAPFRKSSQPRNVRLVWLLFRGPYRGLLLGLPVSSLGGLALPIVVSCASCCPVQAAVTRQWAPTGLHPLAVRV